MMFLSAVYVVLLLSLVALRQRRRNRQKERWDRLGEEWDEYVRRLNGDIEEQSGWVAEHMAYCREHHLPGDCWFCSGRGKS